MNRTAMLVSTTAIAALALTGCAASSAPAGADDTISIVASTNVYGSIAEAIGGDLVTVTSLIDSAAHDPHSFEASAQDQLALSKADLVIENGGGYDPFIDALLGAGSSTAHVITASEASGLLDGDGDGDDHDHAADAEDDAEEAHTEDDGHNHIEGFNEHVWYSLHGVWHVAEHIAEELIELDVDNASVYEANLATFVAGIEGLEAEAEALHVATEGLGVAITEPVPLYLLEAVGLTNETPAEFSEAIEEGTDVPPLALTETLALFDDGAVALLAYNSQTASPETERVREAADAAGIPVLEFTETLPDGADYLSWMTENLRSIAAALGE
jgi:zinc/manganese transport system substrate-binding protein